MSQQKRVIEDVIGFDEDEFRFCGICGKPFTEDDPMTIRNSAIMSIDESNAIVTGHVQGMDVLPGYIGIVVEKNYILNIPKSPTLMVHESCDDAQAYVTDKESIKKNIRDKSIN